jgi:hypothetical protein
MLKRKYLAQKGMKGIDELDIQSEAIWNHIEKLGWQGPNFDKQLQEMLDGLKNFSESTQFHIGLEKLGDCYGAETIRPTGDGDPDVIWIFQDGYSYTFEAKSGKDSGTTLSKKNVQQAKGHREWLLVSRTGLKKDDIKSLVVASNCKCKAEAMPHSKGLYCIKPEELVDVAISIAKSLKGIRTEFVGKEYTKVRPDFKQIISQEKMTTEDIEKLLLKKML